jgi:hypothetical protein
MRVPWLGKLVILFFKYIPMGRQWKNNFPSAQGSVLIKTIQISSRVDLDMRLNILAIVYSFRKQD